MHSHDNLATPHVLCACDHQGYCVANAVILAVRNRYGLHDQSTERSVRSRYSYIRARVAIHSYIEVHSSLRMFMGGPAVVGRRAHASTYAVRALTIVGGMLPFTVSFALLHVDRLSTWVYLAQVEATRVLPHDSRQSVLVNFLPVGRTSLHGWGWSRSRARSQAVENRDASTSRPGAPGEDISVEVRRVKTKCHAQW